MSTVKEKLREVINTQPEDASYEEIVRELIFERMIDRGLEDARKGNLIDNADMGHRIRYGEDRKSNKTASCFQLLV
jgi:predicted transcriptional regulator